MLKPCIKCLFLQMTPMAARQAPGQAPAVWLRSLRVYLGAMAVGNLVWETLHIPLYTIWRTGTAREQAVAVIHCALGDILIALSTLVFALVLVGEDAWPARRFWPVVAITIVCGAAYTIFSEWLNIVVRKAWAYSDLMPVISLSGFHIGLSPLLQWIALPAIALAIIRNTTAKSIHRGLS